MKINVDFLLLILNAIATWICGGTMLYKISLKQLEKHLFYYAWILGFILYGLQLILRAFFYPDFIQIIPLYFAFILFVVGIWSLSRRKKLLYIIIIIYFFTMIDILLFILGIIQLNSALVIGSTLAYLPIAISVLYHRFLFGRNVDKLALGWFLLYFSNILLWGTGWIVDSFAIISKLILLFGIMDYDFIIIMEKVRREWLTRRPPTHTWSEKEGEFKLLIFSHSSFSRKTAYMMRMIQEKIKNDENTYIFSFQDTIPHRELRRMKWVDPERIFVFLFSTGAEKAKKEFMVLPFGMTEIGTALSEVIKKQLNLGRGCTVFFTDLSLLIHVLGTYPCYRMLLNKMGSLREAGIELSAFFHPETHGDQTIVSLFTNIADEVIKL